MTLRVYTAGKRIGQALALCCGALLSGCAMPSDPQHMTVSTMAVPASFPAALHRAMCVRSVTGGETTNPLWASKVSNEDFRTALVSSLDNAGLNAAPNECRYPINVDLLGLSQPAFGLDAEVTSHVNYKVYDAQGKPVLLETISTPYTATFGDSPVGVIRLKRANEGSIRANITQFLEKVRAANGV